MTEQKHTPEPWTTDAACGFPRDVHDADEILIAHCSSEIAARRIVACINACAGLDTEYLETVGLPEFAGKQLCADMVQQELDAVTAQRDQLRAALEMAVRQNSHDMIMTGEELRECELAIAKAKEL